VLGMRKKSDVDHAFAQVEAIGRSQAMIEFNLYGTIIKANRNFLAVMGYGPDEITGKHHSMFVPGSERDTPGYREFWSNLRRGDFQSARYKRVRKDGSPIWIQASYNPVFDKSGKPISVLKLATEITAEKIRAMEDAGRHERADRSNQEISGRATRSKPRQMNQGVRLLHGVCSRSLASIAAGAALIALGAARGRRSPEHYAARDDFVVSGVFLR